MAGFRGILSPDYRLPACPDHIMGAMKNYDIRIRNGGDDAIAAVTELLMGRWISVLKELPPTDEPVLACWSRQKIGMGCAMFRNLFGKYCWTPADQWEECDEPIAWMPLPEPPDAE